MQSKVMKIVGLESYSMETCCMKISKKKKETPFVVSCPKSLCCQKMHFGPLGVNMLQGSKRACEGVKLVNISHIPTLSYSPL